MNKSISEACVSAAQDDMFTDMIMSELACL